MNNFEKQLKVFEYQYVASLIDTGTSLWLEEYGYDISSSRYRHHRNLKTKYGLSKDCTFIHPDLYGYEDMTDLLRGTINKLAHLDANNEEEYQINLKSKDKFDKVCKRNAETILENEYDLFLYLQNNVKKQYKGV